jgi:hypothetical protein
MMRGNTPFRCRYATRNIVGGRFRGLKPTANVLHRDAVGGWMLHHDAMAIVYNRDAVGNAFFMA